MEDKLESEVKSLQNKLRSTIKEEEGRGENLESLERRTERLEQGASQFQRSAQETKSKLFWRNFKWFVVIGIVVLVIVFVLYKALNS